MKKVFIIDSDQARMFATGAVNRLSINPVMQVTIEPETRKLSQNRAQWPILNAIADQVQWPINGMMQNITGEDFKQILTAAYRKEHVRVAQGVDGGVVLLGHRTREFKASEWSDWMEYLEWFAAVKDVKIPINKSQEEQYMI